MTWVTGPVMVEVHWIECPAARDTFAMLDKLGTPYTPQLITDHERLVLARYGHQQLTVTVWIGLGDKRHKYMTISGYNADALRTIHTLLTQNTRAA